MLVFCLVVALSAPAPAPAPAAGRSQIRTGWMGGAVCQLERRGRHQAKTSNSGAHLVARNAGFVLGMALPFKFGAPEKKKINDGSLRRGRILLTKHSPRSECLTLSLGADSIGTNSHCGVYSVSESNNDSENARTRGLASMSMAGPRPLTAVRLAAGLLATA